ncbi:MAG: prolyl aminopeptidase [Telluria sp.]
MIEVDDVHSLYWEEAGNPAGLPVLILHGGPGGGQSPLYRGFFDPALWRIISFDQRGCGKSLPTGMVQRNTTGHLVADIEVLRQFLNVKHWLLFGGSWGATLALAYAQQHPAAVIGLLLRSAFLGTAEEIDWFFKGGQKYHPEAWLAFSSKIPTAEQDNLLEAYHRRLFSGDPTVELDAARAWFQYESCRTTLAGGALAAPDAFALVMAKLESHYFKHLAFLAPDQLVRGMGELAHLPVALVHGRYDMLCPPESSFRLLRAHRGAVLHLVPAAGHSAFEPGMREALLRCTGQFARDGRFSA